MRVSTAGCRRMVASLWRTAGELCGGRLVAVTEGGYDLQALGECLDATVDVLAAGPGAEAPGPQAPTGPAPRGERALEAVRAAQKGFWRQL
jgi:acetoin utilization deacetylase AcuC-like enzyme